MIALLSQVIQHTPRLLTEIEILSSVLKRQTNNKRYRSERGCTLQAQKDLISVQYRVLNAFPNVLKMQMNCKKD